MDGLKSENSLVESLWVDVRLHCNDSLRLGIVYRPPHQNQETDNNLMCEIREGCKNKTLILGDFNLPDIDWNVNVGENAESEAFLECFNDSYLTQIVSEPTRAQNILDLALVTDTDLITDLTVGESLGSSDHNIIRLKLGSNKVKIDNHRLVPDYQRGDFAHFRQLLSNINWVHKFKGKTVEEMWGIFRSTIEQFQQICVPVKKLRNNRTKRPLWWRASIRKAISKKKRAFRAMKTFESEENIEYYKEARLFATKEIRKHKRLSEIDLANKSKKDPKKFFSYYKYNSKKQEKVGPIEHNGKLEHYSPGITHQVGPPTCEMMVPFVQETPGHSL